MNDMNDAGGLELERIRWQLALLPASRGTAGEAEEIDPEDHHA